MNLTLDKLKDNLTNGISPIKNVYSERDILELCYLIMFSDTNNINIGEFDSGSCFLLFMILTYMKFNKEDTDFFGSCFELTHLCLDYDKMRKLFDPFIQNMKDSNYQKLLNDSYNAIVGDYDTKVLYKIDTSSDYRIYNGFVCTLLNQLDKFQDEIINQKN